MIIVLGGLISQCSKEGPMGPAGEDGADGNVTCLACHSSTVTNAIQTAFQKSIHYTSVKQYTGDFTYIYAGRGDNRKGCAPCHTHEGFVEILFTGRDTLTAAFEAPTGITCETCHGSHQSFDTITDGQDYALRLTKPTTLRTSAEVVDLGGTSNSCIACHQPLSDWGDLDDGTGTTVFLAHAHVGPHHGPQATVIMGKGGITDGTAMAHKDVGCTACHMGEVGTDIGGHTFWPNVANCTTCHEGATSFDIDSYQTGLQTKITALKTALQTAGILDVDGHTVPGAHDRAIFQAWWNYMVVIEDKSIGVHNPVYCEALIDAATALL